jgi:hypothetical protein
MTYKLSAHLDGGTIVLDGPLPPNLNLPKITVIIEESANGVRSQDLAQSQSGFVQEVLLDEAEDIWSND